MSRIPRFLVAQAGGFVLGQEHEVVVAAGVGFVIGLICRK